MTDFIHQNFDKLLLALVLLLFCAMAVYGYGHAGSGGQALASFSADQAKEFGGGLLGLITGQALARRDRRLAQHGVPAEPPPSDEAAQEAQNA